MNNVFKFDDIHHKKVVVSAIKKSRRSNLLMCIISVIILIIALLYCVDNENPNIIGIISLCSILSFIFIYNLCIYNIRINKLSDELYAYKCTDKKYKIERRDNGSAYNYIISNDLEFEVNDYLEKRINVGDTFFVVKYKNKDIIVLSNDYYYLH